MKYYEDIVVGVSARFGNYAVTREEVLEFAGKYDPQPFHLDDEAAAATHFGRLAASGWHTAAMMMRMNVDHMTAQKQASLGSPGIDKLRWLKPVYPGDTLTCENVAVDKRRSVGKPDLGLVFGEVSVFNQHGELVMTMASTGMIRVRNPDAPISD